MSSQMALAARAHSAFLGESVHNKQQQSAAPVQRAAPITCAAAPVSRRDALTSAAVAAAAVLAPFSFSQAAFAIGAPKGYSAKEDGQDRYRFYYPYGWQEVAVKGQDVVFRDVIEPLESVSVSIFETDKTSIKDLGSLENVSKALVERVLTGPNQNGQIISTEEKEADGKVYYKFEFTADTPSYKRHAIGVVAVANGKFYTLTTGSKEKRWSKVEEKLRAVADSFEAF